VPAPAAHATCASRAGVVVVVAGGEVVGGGTMQLAVFSLEGQRVWCMVRVVVMKLRQGYIKKGRMDAWSWAMGPAGFCPLARAGDT
jgi:hypothetical protein